MSSEEKCNEISQRLNETVQRVEAVQKGTNSTFSSRVRQHFNKQGNLIVNAALAGCIFFVAVGRLHLKTEFQAGRQRLQFQTARSFDHHC